MTQAFQVLLNCITLTLTYFYIHSISDSDLMHNLKATHTLGNLSSAPRKTTYCKRYLAQHKRLSFSLTIFKEIFKETFNSFNPFIVQAQLS